MRLTLLNSSIKSIVQINELLATLERNDVFALLVRDQVIQKIMVLTETMQDDFEVMNIQSRGPNTIRWYMQEWTKPKSLETRLAYMVSLKQQCRVVHKLLIQKQQQVIENAKLFD